MTTHPRVKILGQLPAVRRREPTRTITEPWPFLYSVREPGGLRRNVTKPPAKKPRVRINTKDDEHEPDAPL